MFCVILYDRNGRVGRLYFDRKTPAVAYADQWAGTNGHWAAVRNRNATLVHETLSTRGVH